MRVRNIRASVSPLHSKMEAVIWAMKCMMNLRQYQVTFATDCFQLVKIVSEPEEWSAFESYLGDIKMLKTCFLSSEIIRVPRTENQKADSLARSAKNNRLSSFTWMQSYQFGSHSQYESVCFMTKKTI